jgi:Raf kinase inhibitor-like YbhB/YbcL family protein
MTERLRGACARLALVMATSLTATAGTVPPLAADLVSARSSRQLSVTSGAFRSGQAIPAPYGQEGDNFSPALGWQSAPPGTRSFAVVLEDPDAAEPKPFVHWTLYNLPSTVTALHESIPVHLQLPDLSGARQGRNSRGTAGYVGPRPPKGDPPHHYHFQVFALDSMLDLPPGAERDVLLAAMKGHVVAFGETVGTFQRP